MFVYNLKHYAHLGDAVWELYVREICVKKTTRLSIMHELTTNFVCASYQAEIINMLENYLNEEEKELVRRGRNIKMTINKRNNPKMHSLATALEVLIGYLHINNKERLNEIFEIVKKNLNEALDSRD